MKVKGDGCDFDFTIVILHNQTTRRIFSYPMKYVARFFRSLKNIWMQLECIQDKTADRV